MRGILMAANNRKKDEKKTKDEDKQQSKSRASGGGRNQKQRGSDNQQQSRGRNGARPEGSRAPKPYEEFDPLGAARVFALRLARSARERGHVYGAMYAYEGILAKYGGTVAGQTAAEEMLEMAAELEEEGKFYTALNIYDKIEEYYSPWQEEFYDPWRPAYVRAKRG
jgi:hypothetical protein